MSQLENLLERIRLKAQRTGIPGSKLTMSNWGDIDEDVCPAFRQIPWDDVLAICIDHKLKDWQIPGQPVCEGEEGYFTRTNSHFLCEPADDA